MLELREPASASAVSLVTEGTQPRTIDLVPGRTYHIMCRDTANTRQFDDDQNLEVWLYNDLPVALSPPMAFPMEGMAAVYASTAVSVEANEWTLVLQEFGGGASGRYTCQGLDVGQSVSLDIGLSKWAGLSCSGDE